ncbi:hypothetical protein A1O3_00919 [Capronia epimyces CBS 606.96]|uniref:Uncharacterized protein n=1 Tax=Capronia epimyces CBS 606.96 TaxID=1182542 RepID=W9ZCZ8_9EURO|nr:uncharacterized protein A1O3_00919 [Capronia epimyces CBS 606.96]EXJ92369.1 hypothetical protein A1O3_00919 [Capronia epimyces CBS 606.96]
MEDVQDLRTRFLQRSARIILLSSPSTSRHLSSQSVELQHSRSSLTSSAANNVCAACGSLLLPGWTVSTRSATQTAVAKPQTTAQKKIRRKILSRKCSSCHRVSRQTAEIKKDVRSLTRQPQISSRLNEKPVRDELPADAAQEKSTKLSSKKRARARKDREGLQSLLDRSAQNKSSLGLSLMDFMRRP